MIIGLTGGIACGKSTVAEMFRNLGAQIIDADKEAHRATRQGTKAYRKIVDYFGKDILNKDFSINREKLGKIVFAYPEKRRQLEEIIHPRVISVLEEKIKKISAGNPESSPALVFIDAPLLVEAGLISVIEKLVVVSAEEQVQLKRLQERGLDEAQAKERIAAQLPLAEKIKLADYVIQTDGSLEETAGKVRKIWKKILKEVK